MKLKPGYKQTDVGMIPEDWEVKTVDSVAFVTSGKRLPLGSSLTESPTLHPYIRVSDMKPGTVSLSNIKYIPNDIFPLIKRYRIFKEDIFISVAGTLGIVGKVPEQLDGANLTENADRITNITCFQDYLLHIFMSPLIQNVISLLQTIGAQPKLALTRIRKFSIPLPPTLTEQKAIANAINDVDALIESLEQLITKKHYIKQGVMQELLTGKKRLTGFTEEWKMMVFEELFNFSGGFPASRDQLSHEGYCYLHYGDIHKSSKTFIDVCAEYQDIPKLDVSLKCISPDSLLSDGDVVFVDASEDDDGTSKYVVIINKEKIKYISGLHTIVAKSKMLTLNHQYTFYCFQTTDIKRQFYYFSVGTKVSGISKNNIKKLVIFVPSLAEQQAIATILLDIDNELAALETKLIKIRQIKKSMMHNLLTGKIRLINPVKANINKESTHAN